MILNETTGVVVQVDFTTGDLVWVVRVKQTKEHHLTVLSAKATDGQELNGCEWKALLSRVGEAEAFWSAVNLEILIHTNGCAPLALA